MIPSQWPQSVRNFSIQLGQVIRDKVRQLTVLEPTPHDLDGVQFWGVGRKPFQPQTLIPLHKCPDQRTLVIATAVPDHDHLPRQTTQYAPQKSDHLERVEIAIDAGGPVQPQPTGTRRDAYPSDHRHFLSLTAVPTDDRRLTSRCPTSADQGIEEQTRLVDQDDVGLFFLRLF